MAVGEPASHICITPGFKKQLLILYIILNHWLLRRRRSNNGIRQLLSSVLFKTPDKGFHISPFLLDTEWHVTKEALLKNKKIKNVEVIIWCVNVLCSRWKPSLHAGSSCGQTHLCSQSPSTDPLSVFFLLFPPPQLNPAEPWQKFGTFKCLGEKSKHCSCTSSCGMEYLEKFI